MEAILYILIFVLGMCVGSFVNMAVYRTAVKYELIKAKKGLLKNRSVCDYCGRQLRWFDNIPVVSWLGLGGKTRCCQEKLSVLYPIVETTTGVLFIINYQFLIQNFPNFGLISIISFFVVGLIVFSTVFDLKYMILPDFATILLVIGAILIFGFRGLIGAVAAGGFLGGLYLLTKGKGIGFGDVKLAIFMGLLLGLSKVILAFYVAFVIGAVVGVGLLVVGKVKRKTPIPFGPFLFLGTLVAWWYGKEILLIFNL